MPVNKSEEERNGEHQTRNEPEQDELVGCLSTLIYCLLVIDAICWLLLVFNFFFLFVMAGVAGLYTVLALLASFLIVWPILTVFALIHEPRNWMLLLILAVLPFGMLSYLWLATS